MHGRLPLALVLAGLLLGSLVGGFSLAPGRAGPSRGVFVEPDLAAQLDSASPSDRLFAVAGYDGPPGPSAVAALEALGLTVVPYRHLPYAAIGGVKDQITGAMALDGVRSLYSNRPVRALSHTAEPDASVMARDTNAYGTGATSVLADRAWALGFTGQGIGVAVLDTGIDTSNPSLALSPLGPTIQNVQVLSDELLLFPQHDVEVYLENQVSTDTFGHGTHVAGSVAGSGLASGGFYTGMAPGAHVIGLDGLQCSIIGLGLVEGMGCLVTILASFDWILENHEEYNIRVNTNSWGSFPPAPFNPDDPISVAVNALVAEGITVLFAAGNEGPGADTMTPESRNPNVVAVAASQPSGGLVEFSSRGTTGSAVPTIASPGHLTISSRLHTGGDLDVFTVLGFDGVLPLEHIPNYLIAQGTSMATPVAAGVAALVLSANPTLTPAQVKQVLSVTATPMLGYATFEVGSGFVNAEAAVRNALGLTAKAARVKLPAQMSISSDPTGGTVTLSHEYRASITGFGLVGFGHFAFSFPVYTNEVRPIEIFLDWETVQDYAVYVTGYRMTVYDPTLTPVLTVDTDILALSHGLTITIDAATRASLTPDGGAYWYMDMVNFNPGWGVLDFTANVQYAEDFRPPFKTETLKPAKLVGKPDRSATHPGGGAQAQGSVFDSNGLGVDGAQVRVDLRSALGLIVWSGTATTVDGHFSLYARALESLADGTYTLSITADRLQTSSPFTVDSTIPGPT
ncbi:MAG TPA: S8 family serine peptidase [Thermoplasmata archaeon]|nr:S8 family serine peptidase [Thermoplasmata archaeon]